MEEIKARETVEQHEGKNESNESLPMPFGIMGAAFLCNVLQYAVLLGLSMIILMLIRILGPS